MAQLYFHYSSTRGVWVDPHGDEIADLTEARERAQQEVCALIGSASTEDWRDWVLHVADELGEEVFTLPFASCVGPLH